VLVTNTGELRQPSQTETLATPPWAFTALGQGTTL